VPCGHRESHERGLLRAPMALQSRQQSVTLANRSMTAASAVRLVVLGATCGCLAYAQADVPPVNDLPNPYRTLTDWLKLPEGPHLGSVGAVDIDRDGSSLWIAERCGANSCANSTPAPVLKIAPSGIAVASFGRGAVRRPARHPC
jgi:hypothetical protein